MASSSVKIVARPIKIGRHCGNEVSAILLSISLVQFDSGDFSDTYHSLVGWSAPVRSASSDIDCGSNLG